MNRENISSTPTLIFGTVVAFTLILTLAVSVTGPSKEEIRWVDVVGEGIILIFALIWALMFTLKAAVERQIYTSLVLGVSLLFCGLFQNVLDEFYVFTFPLQLLENTTIGLGTMVVGLGIYRWVLDLKKSKKELKEQREELETMLSSVKNQREELSSFAHTVSHDLRNYMWMMKNYVQLLRLKKESVEEYSENLMKIIEKTDKFIVRQLQLADAGRAIGESEEVDLGALVRKVAESHAISVHADELPMVRGDPQRLREVFHNLIENAERHGRGDKVEISSRKEKPWYVISVRDNGIGMPQGVAEKIFETGYSTEGTGFGLAIVKKIIEAHGGGIEVTSEEGKGVIFEIIFPSTDDPLPIYSSRRRE
jgi:signal transduction histidine kinase